MQASVFGNKTKKFEMVSGLPAKYPEYATAQHVTLWGTLAPLKTEQRVSVFVAIGNWYYLIRFVCRSNISIERR